MPGATGLIGELVQDGNWVTSRQPSDLPAFNRGNDQSVQPRAPRGATNDVKPKNLSSGQGTTLEIARNRIEACREKQRNYIHSERPTARSR